MKPETFLGAGVGFGITLILANMITTQCNANGPTQAQITSNINAAIAAGQMTPPTTQQSFICNHSFVTSMAAGMTVAYFIGGGVAPFLTGAGVILELVRELGA